MTYILVGKITYAHKQLKQHKGACNQRLRRSSKKVPGVGSNHVLLGGARESFNSEMM